MVVRTESGQVARMIAAAMTDRLNMVQMDPFLVGAPLSFRVSEGAAAFFPCEDLVVFKGF